LTQSNTPSAAGTEKYSGIIDKNFFRFIRRNIVPGDMFRISIIPLKIISCQSFSPVYILNKCHAFVKTNIKIPSLCDQLCDRVKQAFKGVNGHGGIKM
jgi:hypothetical protein